MRNILITGITGRSGKVFGDLLIKNNIPAIAAARDKTKFDNLFGEQNTITFEQCDMRNSQNIEEIIKRYKIDTIFHIVGIHYSTSIILAAKKLGCVKRIILVHTTGIYSKYKAAGADYLKIEDEISKLIEGVDISLTILRPTMVYGTMQDSNVSKFIKMVDKMRLFPLVKGGAYELQPVNYDDLGKAYYQVLINEDATKNKNYILSGGTVVYLKDILKSISKLLGKKTLFFSVPYWMAYSGACALYYLSGKKKDYREKVQRLVEPRFYSHEEATLDFGYAPMTFEEGLEKEVAEFKNSFDG